MRIGITTYAQFAEAAKGLEDTALFKLAINEQLKKVGERPVGKDTLVDILAYCKSGAEFAESQVQDAEKKLRAELAPLKVGAVTTRATEVDGVDLEKIAAASEVMEEGGGAMRGVGGETAAKFAEKEAAVKAAVVQLIVEKHRPTPCAVPLYGAGLTMTGGKTAASGSWLVVEPWEMVNGFPARQTPEGLKAAIGAADCVWMKGELPIIIGIPHGDGADEPSLWALATALCQRFVST